MSLKLENSTHPLIKYSITPKSSEKATWKTTYLDISKQYLRQKGLEWTLPKRIYKNED